MSWFGQIFNGNLTSEGAEDWFNVARKSRFYEDAKNMRLKLEMFNLKTKYVTKI